MPLTSEETCKRKKAYVDIFTAVWFGERHGLAAYQCNVCKKWHLTSRRPWSTINGMRKDLELEYERQTEMR